MFHCLSSHWPFRYHIGKCVQNLEYDATCDLCDEDEQTANHRILECPALSDIRRNNTDFWSVIMNVSPTGNTVTYTKMEVLRDFVLNTNVLKSAFQISGEGIEWIWVTSKRTRIKFGKRGRVSCTLYCTLRSRAISNKTKKTVSVKLSTLCSGVSKQQLWSCFRKFLVPRMWRLLLHVSQLWF